MNDKILLCGNEAIAEAAVQAGCLFYYGYPITPQNEISAYMSKRMPEVNGVFIQSESEIAAINMTFGTSTTGKRTMTSSSSPGISLKMEGVSYMASCELPVVVINVMRVGPGLGNITPSQSDYFQATKGGGHGDYHVIVLAPASVQECADLTQTAFELADKYRIPVFLLLDGIQGQMREPVLIGKPNNINSYDKTWCLTGAENREPNVVKSLYLNDNESEAHQEKLQNKYKLITSNEQRAELYKTESAQILIIAYGTPSRICKPVVDKYRKKGIKIGLFRPVSLWPFPKDELKKLDLSVEEYLVVEWSAGQMIEDVKLTVGSRKPVNFLGVLGGRPMTVKEVEDKVETIIAKHGVHI
ncbi:3-methyl-2-oxobutanoate dehydrogenase subunit VorB [bacterium]|nr:3-methyl-2-oxobutanoate dehydrogenase subunit VorB [bacterium]